jgi:hypothetical protein
MHKYKQNGGKKPENTILSEQFQNPIEEQFEYVNRVIRNHK